MVKLYRQCSAREPRKNSTSELMITRQMTSERKRTGKSNILTVDHKLLDDDFNMQSNYRLQILHPTTPLLLSKVQWISRCSHKLGHTPDSLSSSTPSCMHWPVPDPLRSTSQIEQIMLQLRNVTLTRLESS